MKTGGKHLRRAARIAALWLGTLSAVHAQDASLIVLGDLHLDKFEWHDMEYVATRPQDLAQIAKEYPFYTAAFMPRLFERIKQRTEQAQPPVQAVLQLGDLMQGVAGNETLARRMGRGCVDRLRAVELTVPWILAKGNHDVSNSPGQPEAWKETVLPFIGNQIKTPLTNGMYTYRINDDIQLFVLEQFFSRDEELPETAILDFLTEVLPKSNAKYKFLLTHQPVIPVTERCWHLFSGIRRPVTDDGIRERFLELLAEHRVVVLCAHLHKYSKSVRETRKGTIVQFMFNSVIDGYETPEKQAASTVFPSEENIDKTWQPATLEKRIALLKKEKPFIRTYYAENSAGYGIVSLRNGRLSICYYRLYDDEPYDVAQVIFGDESPGSIHTDLLYQK